MIVLYVLLGLLVLVAALLFVPIHIIFLYRDAPKVRVRVLCFSFDGAKLFEFFTRERKSKKKEDSLENANNRKKQKRKPDLLGFLEFLLHITDVIRTALKEQLSKTKVFLKEFYVSFGTDDAAKTALYYGGVIQAANYLCALLQRFSNFRCNNDKLAIVPDFTAEETKFSIHLDLTVRAFHLISVLLRTYFRLFERKDAKNESNSLKAGH